MGQILRWGILGAGEITHAFVRGLSVLDDHEIRAVGSRSKERAQALINNQNLAGAIACGSYDELAQLDEVDIVYVATIHPQHMACVMQMLQAGKPVLCEKPLAMNHHQAQTMVDKAREKGLFFAEGLWSRFHPVNKMVRQWIHEDRIGTIRTIEANHGFFGGEDKNHRVFNRKLGGGAMLDVGVYPLSMAQFYLGRNPVELVGRASIDSDTGVDRHFAAISSYRDDLIGIIGGSAVQKLSNTARIIGSKGMIVVPNFINPTRAEIYDLGPEEEDEPYLVETFSHANIGNGFEHEARGVKVALDAGRLECEEIPWEDTLAIMKQMTGLLDSWGVTYDV